MAEKKPETSSPNMFVTDDMRKRWAMVSEKDYEIFTAEQNRMMLSQFDAILNQLNAMSKNIRSISTVMNLIGLLIVLSLILGGCAILMGY